MVHQKVIILPPFRKGFHLITNYIESELNSLPQSGLVNIYLKHTSAALSLNENADPSVRFDMSRYIDNLIPEKFSDFTHTLEGPDDMPAHINSSLFGVSITIPVTNGRLNLGMWQGIYLCEFRRNGGSRTLAITVLS